MSQENPTPQTIKIEHNLPQTINIEWREPPIISESIVIRDGIDPNLSFTPPILGTAGHWIPYPQPIDPEKEALRKELEAAKTELAEAKKKLEEKPVSRFKVSHEVVFIPKTD